MALPTTEKYIEAAEAELDIQLPDWLKQRLLRANGGDFQTEDDYWQLFSVLDSSDRKHMARSASTIFRETTSARQWEGFPDKAVAIGSNSNRAKTMNCAF